MQYCNENNNNNALTMTPFLIFLGIAVYFVAVFVALNENEEKCVQLRWK